MEREKIKSIYPHEQAERLIYSIKIGLIGRFKQLVQVRHTIRSRYIINNIDILRDCTHIMEYVA